MLIKCLILELSLPKFQLPCGQTGFSNSYSNSLSQSNSLLYQKSQLQSFKGLHNPAHYFLNQLFPLCFSMNSLKVSWKKTFSTLLVLSNVCFLGLHSALFFSPDYEIFRSALMIHTQKMISVSTFMNNLYQYSGCPLKAP